jgi:hypothetical protein
MAKAQTSKPPFPQMTGGVKTLIAQGGNSIAFEAQTNQGLVRMAVEVGLLPMFIGKLFAVAAGAAKQRGEVGALAEIADQIRGVAAVQSAPKLSLANVMGENQIGIVMEFCGVPFTVVMSPDEGRKFADGLREAADNQQLHAQRKPS